MFDSQLHEIPKGQILNYMKFPKVKFHILQESLIFLQNIKDLHWCMKFPKVAQNSQRLLGSTERYRDGLQFRLMVVVDDIAQARQRIIDFMLRLSCSVLVVVLKHVYTSIACVLCRIVTVFGVEQHLSNSVGTSYNQLCTYLRRK